MPRTRLLAAAALAIAALPGAPATHAAPATAAWTPALAATGAPDNVSAFPDGTMYATVGTVVSGYGQTELPVDTPVLPGDSVGFFKSTDFGATWKPMPPPGHGAWAGTTNLYIRFATPKIGYATYSVSNDVPPDPTGRISPALCKAVTGTFRTTDGGVTWTPLCESHLPGGRAISPSVSPLAVAGDGRTVFVTGTTGESSCKNDARRTVVSVTNDAGSTWRRTLLPQGYTPGWSIRAYDGRTAMLVAYKHSYTASCDVRDEGNAVFLTTDSGRTFRRVFSCSAQPLCTSVAFASRTTLFAGRTDGTTAVSRDGGRSWKQGPTLYESANDAFGKDSRWWFWVQSFSFSDPMHGFASTRGSGSWRTADGGRTWTQERSHECTYYQFGWGENAAATPERAITGGPLLFSVRAPAPAGPGPCYPKPANAPVPGGGYVTRVGDLAVRQDATVVRATVE